MLLLEVSIPCNTGPNPAPLKLMEEIFCHPLPKSSVVVITVLKRYCKIPCVFQKGFISFFFFFVIANN